MSTIDQPASASKTEQRVSRRSASNLNDRIWRWMTMFMIVFMGALMIAPFLWLVTSSLKSQIQIFQYPPKWIPDPIQWDNYSRALTIKPFGLYLTNTLKIVVLNVVAVVFSSSFVAYGFARIKFPGRDFWFGIVMATLFLPYAILIVPLFMIFTQLGWIDTIAPLTVPLFFGGGAFNIFLCANFSAPFQKNWPIPPVLTAARNLAFTGVSCCRFPNRHW